MLEELARVHESLLAVLDELDALTGAASPDETAVASARARLGRLSGQRRRMFDAACNRLSEDASPHVLQRIKTLRELNAAQLAASTTHIGAWGLKQLVEDWHGYVRTAAPMRQSMRDLIAADREILFPMLRSAGTGGAP